MGLHLLMPRSGRENAAKLLEGAVGMTAAVDEACSPQLGCSND